MIDARVQELLDEVGLAVPPASAQEANVIGHDPILGSLLGLRRG